MIITPKKRKSIIPDQPFLQYLLSTTTTTMITLRTLPPSLMHTYHFQPEPIRHNLSSQGTPETTTLHQILTVHTPGGSMNDLLCSGRSDEQEACFAAALALLHSALYQFPLYVCVERDEWWYDGMNGTTAANMDCVILALFMTPAILLRAVMLWMTSDE
jgi:hypothetical protein